MLQSAYHRCIQQIYESMRATLVKSKCMDLINQTIVITYQISNLYVQVLGFSYEVCILMNNVKNVFF